MTQTPIVFYVPDEVSLGLGAASIRRVLTVPYLSQPVSNWCWATCATMLSHFVTNRTLKICEAASTLIPKDGCCAGAPEEGTFDRSWNRGSCNRTCSVSEVRLLHGRLGMASTHIAGSVSFEELRAEIVDAGRSVEVAYRWTHGGGHVALVCGIDGATRNVNINDPWPDYGQMVVPYDTLVSAYGLGTWFHTWTGISTAGA